MKSSTNFCLLGDCSHAPFHRTHPELFFLVQEANSKLHRHQPFHFSRANQRSPTQISHHICGPRHPLSTGQPGSPNFFEGKSTGFCPLSHALIYEFPILLGKPFHSFFGLNHHFYGLNMVKHGFLHGPPSFLLVKPSFFLGQVRTLSWATAALLELFARCGVRRRLCPGHQLLRCRFCTFFFRSRGF